MRDFRERSCHARIHIIDLCFHAFDPRGSQLLDAISEMPQSPEMQRLAMQRFPLVHVRLKDAVRVRQRA